MDHNEAIRDARQLGPVKMLILGIQHLFAMFGATILVPILVQGYGLPLNIQTTLFFAGVGTLFFHLCSRFQIPAFLGSSFAFLGSMGAAFAGAASASAGYAGLLLGAVFAGLVYVVIAIVVKLVGVKWINKLMPPVVIGPTVALIGLSLAVNAVNDLKAGKVGVIVDGNFVSTASPYVTLVIGIITLLSIFVFSVYGKKMMKLIPFIMGILVGYVVASIFTVIGIKTGNVALQVINFAAFKDMQIFAVPEFSFIKALQIVNTEASVFANIAATIKESFKAIDGAFITTVAVAYVPVAFVVFAEHIADHKNLSTIIDQDLLEEPGLHRTLLGDGIGSIAGAFFGGCPNTTYGESVGCVAITRNASVVTITTAAIMCMVISFFGPFVTFLSSIPNCVMGGVCVALYGFIAVSGLKMIQKVDLNASKNLFVVASILIPGIGGLSVSFGKVTLTTIACALILGIITNTILAKGKEE